MKTVKILLKQSVIDSTKIKTGSGDPETILLDREINLEAPTLGELAEKVYETAYNVKLDLLKYLNNADVQYYYPDTLSGDFTESSYWYDFLFYPDRGSYFKESSGVGGKAYSVQGIFNSINNISLDMYKDLCFIYNKEHNLHRNPMDLYSGPWKRSLEKHDDYHDYRSSFGQTIGYFPAKEDFDYIEQLITESTSPKTTVVSPKKKNFFRKLLAS